MKNYRDEIESPRPSPVSRAFVGFLVFLQVANSAGLIYVYSLTAAGNDFFYPQAVSNRRAPSPTSSPTNTGINREMQSPAVVVPSNNAAKETLSDEQISANLIGLVEKLRDDEKVSARMRVLAEKLHESKIEQAMKESKVVDGMTHFQVRQVRGTPTSVTNGKNLPDELRKLGVFEVWFFENLVGNSELVYFDRDGIVVARQERP